MTDNSTNSDRDRNSSTGLHRRDPFALAEELNQDLFRFFDGPYEFSMPFALPRLGRTLARMAPRIDMFEKDQNFVITAELPGVKKEDLQVELQDHALIVRGERNEEHEDKEDGDNRYYRMERSRGKFYRRIRLPFDTVPENVKASFSDGVLEVRIPEPSGTATGAKQIPVS